MPTSPAWWDRLSLEEFAEVRIVLDLAGQVLVIAKREKRAPERVVHYRSLSDQALMACEETLTALGWVSTVQRIPEGTSIELWPDT